MKAGGLLDKFDLGPSGYRPSQWSIAELAYLAGLLDGEGCLTMTRPHPGRQAPRMVLQIGNTKPQMISWLVEHFGGTTWSRHTGRKTDALMYSWRVVGDAAVSIVRAVF